MEHTGLAAKIADYIASRAKPKLEALEKKAEKECNKTQDPEALHKVELTLSEERQELEERFAPANWLTDAARRAKQRQLVTHALKFTHSDAKGSSLYAPGGEGQPERMQEGTIVSTASLPKTEIDSVGNAAALDVAGLLQLEQDGETLIEHIRMGDAMPLQAFADSDEQLAEWLDGFSQVLSGSELSSHKFAKQLYFPIDESRYHLLAPLYPSSLVHAVHGRIAASRFSEGAKLVRKAKRESKYNDSLQVDYPDTAVQSFGGTKPQNVSQLNSSRGGRTFLLSCAPPTWQTQAKPPLGVKSVFSRNHFGLRVGKETWLLRHYLEQQVDKENAVAIRNRRAEMIDELIDHLIQYGAEIQNFREHAGWSALPECKLSRAEQLWLDPHRGDETFAQERKKNDWQAAVADQFAFWLNNRIKSKKLTPGDVEHREWKSLLEQKLRLLKEDLEVFA